MSKGREGYLCICDELNFSQAKFVVVIVVVLYALWLHCVNNTFFCCIKSFSNWLHLPRHPEQASSHTESVAAEMKSRCFLQDIT